jgi:hypothetical protein
VVSVLAVAVLASPVVQHAVRVLAANHLLVLDVSMLSWSVCPISWMYGCSKSVLVPTKCRPMLANRTMVQSMSAPVFCFRVDLQPVSALLALHSSLQASHL